MYNWLHVENLSEKIISHKWLLLVALILFAINIPRCFNGNFWLDETCTIYISKMSFSEVIQNSIDYDMHPPLYYLMISAVQKVFGDSIFAFHFLTLLTYGVILIYCAIVVSDNFGKRVALITMLLVTTMSTAIYFNTELRMYELAMLSVLVTFVSFYNILQYDRTKDWCWFVVFTLIGAYTYYYCIIIVAFLYIVLLIRAVMKREMLNKFVYSCIAIIICYIPGMLFFIETFKRGTASFWITEIINYKQMMEYFFESGFSKILVLLFIVLGIFMIWDIYKKGHQDEKFSLRRYLQNIDTKSLWVLSGVLAIVGTIAVLIVVSLIYRPLATPKHLFPLVAIVWLLFAIFIDYIDFKSIKRYVPALIVVAIAVIGFSNLVLAVNEENSKWDSTQNILNHTDDWESGGIIITDIEPFRYNDGRGVLQYYYPGSTAYYDPDLKIPTLDPNTEYWIFSHEEITEKTVSELAEQGYKADFRAGGSFAKTYWANAYKVVKI